jgi:hypothetical protein
MLAERIYAILSRLFQLQRHQLPRAAGGDFAQAEVEPFLFNALNGGVHLLGDTGRLCSTRDMESRILLRLWSVRLEPALLLPLKVEIGAAQRLSPSGNVSVPS